MSTAISASLAVSLIPHAAGSTTTTDLLDLAGDGLRVTTAFTHPVLEPVQRSAASVFVARSVASSPHTDADTLSWLARDPRHSVRLAVAGNTSTPEGASALLFDRACIDNDAVTTAALLACHNPLVVLRHLNGWLLNEFDLPHLQRVGYGGLQLDVEGLITNLARQDPTVISEVCDLPLPWVHAVTVVAAARGVLSLTVNEVLTLTRGQKMGSFTTAELHRLAVDTTLAAGRALTVELIDSYEVSYAAAAADGVHLGFSPVRGLVAPEGQVLERLCASPVDMLRAIVALSLVGGGIPLTENVAGGLVELAAGFPDTAGILLGSDTVRSVLPLADLLTLIEHAATYPPAITVATTAPDSVLAALDWDGLRRVLRCSGYPLTLQWLRGELPIAPTSQRVQSLAADPGRAFGDITEKEVFSGRWGSVSALLRGDDDPGPLVFELVASATLDVAAHRGPLSPAAAFVGDLLTRRFGDKPAMWRTALTLGESFDGTFTDLCDAVDAVHYQPVSRQEWAHHATLRPPTHPGGWGSVRVSPATERPTG